jgi:hypothetical protein
MRDQGSNAEQEIRDLRQEMISAMIHADPKVLDRILAEIG